MREIDVGKAAIQASVLKAVMTTKIVESVLKDNWTEEQEAYSGLLLWSTDHIDLYDRCSIDLYDPLQP